MTDTSPVRWHANTNPSLRDARDTIDDHQRRVTTLCHSLADHIGHPLTDSDLLHAAANHDQAERVLGDIPAPAKMRFHALASAYETAEQQVLADMGLTWTLTAKEQQMLRLCDRLDAYLFAKSKGVTGAEWDELRTVLDVMADKFHAQDWVAAQ